MGGLPLIALVVVVILWHFSFCFVGDTLSGFVCCCVCLLVWLWRLCLLVVVWVLAVFRDFGLGCGWVWCF